MYGPKSLYLGGTVVLIEHAGRGAAAGAIATPTATPTATRRRARAYRDPRVRVRAYRRTPATRPRAGRYARRGAGGRARVRVVVSHRPQVAAPATVGLRARRRMVHMDRATCTTALQPQLPRSERPAASIVDEQIRAHKHHDASTARARRLHESLSGPRLDSIASSASTNGTPRAKD